MVCWKCTKPGHSGRECPEITCYVCNMKGHMAFVCPDRAINEGEGKNKCLVHGANAFHTSEECDALKAFVAQSIDQTVTNGPGNE